MRLLFVVLVLLLAGCLMPPKPGMANPENDTTVTPPPANTTQAPNITTPGENATPPTNSTVPSGNNSESTAPSNVTTPPAGNTTVTPPGNTTITPPTNNTTSPPVNSSSANITIATFNIQVFGISKRSKPEVMEVLTKTARRFDIMAIQELRDESETTLPFYLEGINNLSGPRYAAVSSPRLGRTSSKENYAFIYDTATVSLVPGSVYTFEDPPAGTSADLFQREPFIARFNTTGGFDFVLITIHTDPDTTPQELSDLPMVLADAQAHFPDEQDFIMLGDMNADCTYLRPSDALSLRNATYLWIVPDSADTTTKSTDCAYDRIITAGPAEDAFTGAWGVFRFDSEYSLNQSATEAVSDHYPVWAAFQAG
jgi:deoxyribonuclease-1-like protein